ncbi:hypothetical protein BJV78DRAFT_87348 [Lactifluus subvellereus]|nr:hypothetical protein BJV78DRAFT_87348 [Lactifluus subvellereus]
MEGGGKAYYWREVGGLCGRRGSGEKWAPEHCCFHFFIIITKHVELLGCYIAGPWLTDRPGLRTSLQGGDRASGVNRRGRTRQPQLYETVVADALPAGKGTVGRRRECHKGICPATLSGGGGIGGAAKGPPGGPPGAKFRAGFVELSGPSKSKFGKFRQGTHTVAPKSCRERHGHACLQTRITMRRENDQPRTIKRCSYARGLIEKTAQRFKSGNEAGGLQVFTQNMQCLQPLSSCRNTTSYNTASQY